MAANLRELPSGKLTSENLQVRFFSAAYRLSKLVVQKKSPQAFCSETIALLKANTMGRRISIILKNEGNTFSFVAGANFTTGVLNKGTVTIKDNVLGWVSKNKQGVLCEDINSDNRFGRNKKLRYNSTSFISVPCLVNGRVTGFISVTEHKSHVPFTENDFDFLISLSEEFIENYNLILSQSKTKPTASRKKGAAVPAKKLLNKSRTDFNKKSSAKTAKKGGK